jgi:ethanolamine utilization protein EutQ (cupin superfamily)
MQQFSGECVFIPLSAFNRNSRDDIDMNVRKFTIADASLERSPGQEGDVFAGNLVDQRHGGPITVGYGRYAPSQSIDETLAVDDVMVVLEGRLSVSTDAGTVTAGPGEIVYMPKGTAIKIRSHEEGAVTAYVTYPHWQEALAT